MRWFREWRNRRKMAKFLRQHGHILFCFQCREHLDGYGTPSWLSVYEYRCAHCRAVSHFDFSSYPIPVRVRSTDEGVES